MNWFREFDNIIRNGISEEHRLFARRYAKKAKLHIDRAMKSMDLEARETREMAFSFYRLLEHKLRLSERNAPPTKEEVRVAVEQLKDIGKYSIFATAVVLPGGVISLVGLELLARRYGINFTLVPSAFRTKDKTPKDEQFMNGKKPSCEGKQNPDPPTELPASL